MQSKIIHLLLSSSAFARGLWGSAAPDEAATPLDPPTQTAFRLDEVPNGFNHDPQNNQAILFVVDQFATSHSLQHTKFAKQSFLRHGQTI